MELQKKKAEEEEAQSIQDDYDWKACRLNLNIYAIKYFSDRRQAHWFKRSSEVFPRSSFEQS